MNRTEYSRWNDEPARRQAPPAQPPGWVDPPQHVAPPTRPQQALVDDGYYVEEEVEPRLPFSGWESMRDRWDQAGKDPISHRAAFIGAVVCALVIALIVILVATPRAAADGSPAIQGGLSSAHWPASVPPQPLGAPQADPASRGGSLLGDIGGAPPSSGVLGIYWAQATWCKPTADHCQSWAEPAHLAAVYGFRFDDRPYWVRVWRGDAHTDALVVSHCACHHRHDRIDLSVAAFREIAAPRLGRVAVKVEVLDWPYEPGGDPPPHPDDDRMRVEDGGPRPTLPPTDKVAAAKGRRNQ